VSSDVDLFGVADEGTVVPPGLPVLPPEELAGGCDLLVAAGGDGTILSALHHSASSGVAVLGVNLGHLGFLAGVDEPELAAALAAVAGGDFCIDELTPLSIPPGTLTDVVGDGTAYNDVLFSRSPGAGPALLAVRVDGDVFARYAALGVIASTPTGSTAYNLSAGGPIISPGVAAMVVTPVAAHGRFRSPLVLPPGDQLRIEVLPGSSPIAVELDGHLAATLERATSVPVSLTGPAARIVRLHRGSFYRQTAHKLQAID
jgi:NAD+ kinase